jgi:hypothetical protein
MSEWLKEHAWKAIQVRGIEQHETLQGAIDSTTSLYTVLSDVTP